jgi:CelD/BcsL family acetyltransferase involved in cellulose biosynthesis
VLEFLGGGQCDYNTPIMVPELLMPGKFSMLWERVLEELPAHDVRYFLRVPQLLGNLRNPFLDVAHSFYDGPAYAAALSDSWDEFQSGLPAKFRKDNARMIRRLSEIGQLRFIVASTDAEFGNIVDAMFAQKERRYKETGAINILADINVRAFYRDSGTAICGDAKIHLSALILNDEILATHWGVFHRDRFYYLFPAFASEAWAKFSPGRLLLEHLVQWAIDNRVRIFDFTTGGESYKEIWCDSEMQLSRIVQPLTGVGHLFTWVQALIYWVKTNRRSRALAMRVLHVLSALNRH